MWYRRGYLTGKRIVGNTIEANFDINFLTWDINKNQRRSTKFACHFASWLVFNFLQLFNNKFFYENTDFPRTNRFCNQFSVEHVRGNPKERLTFISRSWISSTTTWDIPVIPFSSLRNSTPVERKQRMVNLQRTSCNGFSDYKIEYATIMHIRENIQIYTFHSLCNMKSTKPDHNTGKNKAKNNVQFPKFFSVPKIVKFRYQIRLTYRRYRRGWKLDL